MCGHVRAISPVHLQQTSVHELLHGQTPLSSGGQVRDIQSTGALFQLLQATPLRWNCTRCHLLR